MASISQVKPHAVLIPFPMQSHLFSMLKLAKLLHHRGFHITYVITEFNKKRLLKSKGPNALDGLPDFRFETIPDGLPPTDVDITQDIPSLCDSTSKNCLLPLRQLLARLNESSPNTNGLVPPVSCLVSDAVMTFAIKAAEEIGVPILIYCPISAYSYLQGLAQIRSLVDDKGIIPLKDESYSTNEYLNTQIDGGLGMQNIRIKDLLTLARTIDLNDLMMNFLLGEIDRIQGATAISFNTFEKLEDDAVKALSSIFSLPLYTIGPIHFLANQIPQNDFASIGVNFWKEETSCLEWLESKEPRSIIYVNFGSNTVMSQEQLYEFAWGLANSKKPFLWIIRPDLINGGSIILSSEFVNEVEDKGLIVSWCPQEQVLNHPSIGGFLTHCGWNSMVESICAGVPMLCWPFDGDQPTNCRYACTEWGIGMKIDNNVKRKEVEKLINELMIGENGKKMKEKIMELKRKAEEDSRPGGSSYMNFDKVIKEVLLKQYH